MITDTEGIVLRQIKTVNGRTMLSVFSRKYGKISVGMNSTGSGRNKSALAARPFTYAQFELFKGRDTYNLNSGNVIKSHFGIGENLDKFMAASYVLELTERMLPEEMPQIGLFTALTGFLGALEKREKDPLTLVLAYMVKALNEMGTMPELTECVLCGTKNPGRIFSVEEGGVLCEKCASEILKTDDEPLIYAVKFDIINILKYFREEPFSRFEKLALDRKIAGQLLEILKKYLAYHMDISNLKSEFNEDGML